MKALVAGLVLLSVSGLAILWHFRTAPAGDKVVEGPERTTRCMVWKATRGAATVWLCGSLHFLRPTDYPLPAPYLQAFDEAKTVLMELEPVSAPGEKEGRVRAAGLLPDGDSLEKHVAPETWAALGDWCRGSGTDLGNFVPLKPWRAAAQIPARALQRAGYSSTEGMERFFTSRAEGRAVKGLETVESQLGVFDTINPKTQEEMILQALSEDGSNSRLPRLASAWREGAAAELAALVEAGFSRFPEVRRILLDDRHASWLSKIEPYLDGQETVMVLVGAAHLAGSGSLVELLEKRGVTLTQMEYRTRRLKE